MRGTFLKTQNKVLANSSAYSHLKKINYYSIRVAQL